MREIDINGMKFEVRGLKGKEIKAMKKAGLPITRIGLNLQADKDGLNQLDNIIDAAFEKIFPEATLNQVEDLGNTDQLELWKAIQAETFGSPVEEKNLSTSGDGEPTKAE